MNATQKKSSADQRLTSRLQEAGLRATKQRIALAAVLLDGKPHHVTAEAVWGISQKKGLNLSLATVYNCLNQFTTAGLLREISVGSTCTYFDTTLEQHAHFFDEETQMISDAPADCYALKSVPSLPKGRVIKSIDLIIRLRSAN